MNVGALAVNGRRLLLVGMALAGWLTPLAAQRAGAPTLGLDGLVAFREEGSVATLAMATPFWKGVATRSEDLLGDFRYLPEYASSRAKGQVFEILESDAPEWLGVGTTRFVAVPWSFGPGCAEEGWQSPTWVEPGDTVAFLLFPTRTRGDEDLPVFDVLGWHQPYPVGELIPFWRTTRERSREWISSSEFFQLLALLPSELAFRADPEGALAPVMAWIRQESGRASHFPVAEILERWEKRGYPASGLEESHREGR